MSLRRSSNHYSRYLPRPHKGVTHHDDWDTRVPHEFIDYVHFNDEVYAQIKQEVLARLQALKDTGALDEAHARILDLYIDYRFAPYLEDTKVEHRVGTRWGEEYDATAHKDCEEASQKAWALYNQSQEAEQQADAVYLQYVGLTRPHTREGITHTQWALKALDWCEAAFDPAKDPGLPPDECDFWNPPAFPPAFKSNVSADLKTSDEGETSTEQAPADSSTLAVASNGETSSEPKHAVAPYIFPTGVLGWLGVGMIADLADPILGYGTFYDILNNADPLFTFFGVNVTLPVLVVVAFYTVSLVLPALIGACQAKIDSQEGGRQTRLMRGWLFATWVALGVVMLVIRLFDEMASATNAIGNVATAVLMMVCFAATGLTVYHAAHQYFSSAWHHVHSILRKARKAGSKATHAIAYAIQAMRCMRKNTYQATLQKADRDDHLRRIEAARKELKSEVRIALAVALGDPASSSLVFESFLNAGTDDAPNPQSNEAEVPDNQSADHKQPADGTNQESSDDTADTDN